MQQPSSCMGEAKIIAESNTEFLSEIRVAKRIDKFINIKQINFNISTSMICREKAKKIAG